MHFVAALDRVPGMRCVLGLFEGVVTGAADGYARMTGKPAATLLHCGPGLGERPRQPAQRPPRAVADRQHRRRPGDLSPAERCAADRGYRGLGARRLRLGPHRHLVATVGADAAVAVQAARTHPGQIATLILPSDTSWDEGGMAPTRCRCRRGRAPTRRRSSRPPRSCARGLPTLIVLGGEAVRADALETRTASPPPPARA